MLEICSVPASAAPYRPCFCLCSCSFLVNPDELLHDLQDDQEDHLHDHCVSKLRSHWELLETSKQFVTDPVGTFQEDICNNDEQLINHLINSMKLTLYDPMAHLSAELGILVENEAETCDPPPWAGTGRDQ